MFTCRGILGYSTQLPLPQVGILVFIIVYKTNKYIRLCQM